MHHISLRNTEKPMPPMGGWKTLTDIWIMTPLNDEMRAFLAEARAHNGNIKVTDSPVLLQRGTLMHGHDVTIRSKVIGSFFDHPLRGGGHAVGMGRFFRTDQTQARVEVDWAQLTVDGCMFRKHAISIAKQLGITEFVAPDPNSSAPTRSPENMPCVIELGDDITLRYGMAADACYPLRKDQAYLLRSGGCPAIRVHYPGDFEKGIWRRTGAGHGSLNSLLKNLPATLIRDMGLTNEQCKEVFVSIVAPISTLSFSHPTLHKENGSKHRELCISIADRGEHWHRCVPSIHRDRTKDHSGQIDLGLFATMLFEELGVPRKQISVLANTVDISPRHTDGSPRWYTTRNWPMYSGNPEDAALWRKRRNLIIITAA